MIGFQRQRRVVDFERRYIDQRSYAVLVGGDLAGMLSVFSAEGTYEILGASADKSIAIRAKDFGPYADPQLGAVGVDFLSDVDTTGGNSGSPTLNAKGELCGLLFDGTFESLGSDYLPTTDTRSIHVDATYLLWVMDRVDHAHNLLQEMGITPKF